MERHEREWKATWDDDAWDRAREFELFDPEYPVEELEAQEEADVNQCLPAPVQANTTQSAALLNIGQPCPGDTACPRNGAPAFSSKRC